MITRIPFGDCCCIWAEPKLYGLLSKFMVPFGVLVGIIGIIIGSSFGLGLLGSDGRL